MKYLKELFYRDLNHCVNLNRPRGQHISLSDDDILYKIDYHINTYGYRSAEFIPNNPKDILFLGCSQTQGNGMVDEYTWPNIFSQHLNKQFDRLAVSGDSIQGQVYKAFKYFEEIGNPKVVLACFPLLRIEVPQVKDKFEIVDARLVHPEIEFPHIFRTAFLSDKTIVDLFKKPYDPESVLPEEYAVYIGFSYLQMLEQYCKSNSIKFLWTIWDDPYVEEDLEKNIPSILNNYVKGVSRYFLNEKNILCYKSSIFAEEKKLLNCHTEFNNHILFNHAADYIRKKHVGHWGIHMHYHVAENFIKKYKELYDDK